MKKTMVTTVLYALLSLVMSCGHEEEHISLEQLEVTNDGGFGEVMSSPGFGNRTRGSFLLDRHSPYRTGEVTRAGYVPELIPTDFTTQVIAKGYDGEGLIAGDLAPAGPALGEGPLGLGPGLAGTPAYGAFPGLGGGPGQYGGPGLGWPDFVGPDILANGAGLGFGGPGFDGPAFDGPGFGGPAFGPGFGGIVPAIPALGVAPIPVPVVTETFPALPALPPPDVRFLAGVEDVPPWKANYINSYGQLPSRVGTGGPFMYSYKRRR
jgi:hypothetical protein